MIFGCYILRITYSLKLLLTACVILTTTINVPDNKKHVYFFNYLGHDHISNHSSLPSL